MAMTPKEHIEQIRKTKFSIGGELNPLTEDLHQAVKNLSAELYAKDVHFLMELIQNAEDNEYGEGVNASLEFIITSRDITATGAPSTLLIFNNEKGFFPKNIDSLCSVGRSTKKGNRQRGYIGEKVNFDPQYLSTLLKRPVPAHSQSRMRTESAEVHRSKKRKENAESSSVRDEIREEIPSPHQREEPAPYHPGWAINMEDSALSEVRIAHELIQGSQLPVNRAAIREKTSGTVMGASEQVAASVILHIGELCNRLKVSMELNNSLEDEKSAAYAHSAHVECQMQEAMDKLGISESEHSKTQAALSSAKKEVKRAGKRAVDGFKSSGEYKEMVAQSSAIAYSMGTHRLLDHLKSIYPDLDIGEYDLPVRVTQAGPVLGEEEKGSVQADEENTSARTPGSMSDAVDPAWK